jgi:hypothetical protein
LCFVFSERKYNFHYFANKAKHYLISLIKIKNDSIDARGLSKWSRTMFRIMEPMGKFFYELRQYTRQYQNLNKKQFLISFML